ncbi:MAG: HEAT repeat domain-containing protein [Planctomycetota bacterium]|nr:HEAT repeat domain-containing protein [Planctomycetota bacterium]
MRTLVTLLCLSGLGWAQMGPAKRVDTWTSKHNQKRLRLNWEVLPKYAPTKLPDGSEEPPRAPWPFLIIVQDVDSKSSHKIQEDVQLDTRFVVAAHAVKPVRIKPGKAIDLPYLASVKGIKDPTIIVLSRAFKVVGVLKVPKDFHAKRVLPVMAKAANAEYTIKLSKYVGGYLKLLTKGEALWKREMKADKLREKAAAAGPNKRAKYDKEADAIEKAVEPGKLDLEDAFLSLEESLAIRPDEEEALPTSIGTGKNKRKLTPQEIEAIAAYREFARNKNPIVRAAAVEDLGAIDSAAMVSIILKAANDTDPRVVWAAGKALSNMKSDESLEAMTAALSSGNSNAKTAVILGFADGTRVYAPAVPLIIKLYAGGSDDVRRAVIRALERQGDSRAEDVLIRAVADKRPALRVMAATALGVIRAKRATSILVEGLGVSDWSMRKACAEALGKTRQKEAVGPLIAKFKGAKGLDIEVLYKALVAITGEDFRYSSENWAKWWDKYGVGFKIPSDAEIAKKKKQRENSLKGYYDPRKKKYHTIETFSRKMVFVVDVSSSMREKIIIPPYAPQSVRDAFPDREKWTIAEKELTELLAGLNRNVFFNIITFAGKAKSWQDSLANGSMRTSAIKYIAKLKPQPPSRGGGRRGVKSGQSDDKKTNTYAALMAAFGQADASVPNWKARTKVDTIFFVTDGMPTTGTITDVPKLVDFFTEMNRSRGIVIHVIVFDRDAARKLRPLASRNGGQCVLRGWDGEIAEEKKNEKK